MQRKQSGAPNESAAVSLTVGHEPFGDNDGGNDHSQKAGPSGAPSAARANTSGGGNGKPQKTTDLLGRTCAEPSYLPPLRPHIATVVFPGFLASFGQACKYTGPDAVTVLDREDRSKVIATVRCQFSPRVLHNVLPAPDVRENALGWSFTPLGLFSCLKTAGTRWFFRMPDLPMVHSVASLNNMGGAHDQADCVARITDALAQIDAEAEAEEGSSVQSEEESNSTTSKKKKEKRKLVLFGFSRGAATVLHTALKLPEAIASRISLVVAEAPFDTFEGVMADSSWFPSVNRALFNAIARPSDPSAYDFPPSTHLRCPIAFITSEGDTRVPPKTTQRCIDAVRANYPHIAVEHLELRKARHPVMTYSNRPDMDAYIAFMEGLYDKYVLPEGEAVAAAVAGEVFPSKESATAAVHVAAL